MSHKDYYRTLGVDRGATPSQVKRSYRQLARKLHPDVNTSDESAAEKFKEVQEAYQVLSDPEKRGFYDRHGFYRDGVSADTSDVFREAGDFPGFAAGGNGWGAGQGSISDLFSELFSARRSQETRTRPERVQNLEHSLTIPFLDAIEGTKSRITFSRKESCPSCQGQGGSREEWRPCSSCRGSGQVYETRGGLRFKVACKKCDSRGRVRSGNCPRCGGEGTVRDKETVTVGIPAGVDSGSRVRIPAKGNVGRFGGARGDLYLIVNVEPHPYFHRRGNDILVQVPLTVTEAALGTEIEVPTVKGKARLTIPPGTQSGQKFRLRGRGAPSLKRTQRGDQLVEVAVLIPEIYDERSKELLREFASLHPENPRSDLST